MYVVTGRAHRIAACLRPPYAEPPDIAWADGGAHTALPRFPQQSVNPSLSTPLREPPAVPSVAARTIAALGQVVPVGRSPCRHPARAASYSLDSVLYRRDFSAAW